MHTVVNAMDSEIHIIKSKFIKNLKQIFHSYIQLNLS